MINRGVTESGILPLSENVRAQLRVIVKRILRKYGYPPDKQEKATRTVLKQAEYCPKYGRWPEKMRVERRRSTA